MPATGLILDTVGLTCSLLFSIQSSLCLHCTFLSYCHSMSLSLKDFQFSFFLSACCVLSLQSSLTLCNPIDCSLPGASVHGILQATPPVSCHGLFQGIFLTQGSNPPFLCLVHWQAGSLPLTPPGKPHPELCRFSW